MRFNRSRNHSCKSAMRHAWGRACSFVTKKIPYGRFDRPIIRLSSHRRVQRRFARSMMGGGDAPEEESGNYDSALRQLSLSESRRGVMESFLEQYSGSSWVCYWDGSFGPPRDPASTYVFRPALGQTNSGFVSKESLVSTFVQVPHSRPHAPACMCPRPCVCHVLSLLVTVCVCVCVCVTVCVA